MEIEHSISFKKEDNRELEKKSEDLGFGVASDISLLWVLVSLWRFSRMVIYTFWYKPSFQTLLSKWSVLYIWVLKYGMVFSKREDQEWLMTIKITLTFTENILCAMFVPSFNLHSIPIMVGSARQGHFMQNWILKLALNYLVNVINITRKSVNK